MAGAAILRVDIPPGLLHDLREALNGVSWGEFRALTKALEPLMWAYALGSTIGALLLAAGAFRASLTMIVAHRQRLSIENKQKTLE
jgi:hypothetical protein